MKRAAPSFSVLCSARELSVATLSSGQAFRWRFDEDKKCWLSPLGSSVYRLYFQEAQVEFEVIPPGDAAVHRAFLRDYFRLDVDLDALVAQWRKRDAKFSRKEFEPVRQLRQDPFETLMSFICSQNNNVKRITQMIDTFCKTWGSPLADGLFAFPTLEQLTHVTEEELRKLGFGYRAPYICAAVKFFQTKEADYLHSLRLKSVEECRSELIQIKGVGLKVADCVALFSLDQRSIVPIDTHIWQIAKNVYQFDVGEETKTLTPKLYRVISKKFSDLWGAEEAGWAHSLCFNEKLKAPAQKKQKKKAKKEVNKN
jgi:N-glycosylase/DNA lyase